MIWAETATEWPHKASLADDWHETGSAGVRQLQPRYADRVLSPRMRILVIATPRELSQQESRIRREIETESATGNYVWIESARRFSPDDRSAIV